MVPAESAAEQTLPFVPLTRGRELLLGLCFRARTRWRSGTSALKAAAIVLVGLLVLVLMRNADSTGTAASATSTTSAPPTSATSTTPTPSQAKEDPEAIPPRRPTPEQLFELPVATVGAVLGAAVPDPAPATDPGTAVLHPVEETVVYTEPGGHAVARLPSTQFAAPTWVPLIDRRPGWAMVLLPGNPLPDGASPAGWIHLDANVELTTVGHRIHIDRANGTAAVLTELGRITLAQTGTPAAPPTGRRTFVAVSATTTPRGLIRWWWPALVTGKQICTTRTAAISIPNLPAQSPLGQLDDRGCLTTPADLQDLLREVPAGAVVLLR